MRHAAKLACASMVALACLGRAGASESTAAADLTARTVLTYERLDLKADAESPEACLHFNAELKPDAEARYGDYLRFAPAATPAVRVDGRDLCVAGLARGTAYQLTLRRGLPAAQGQPTQAETRVAVTLPDRSPLVAIAGGGFVLARDVANGLVVQTVNVEAVKVHVLRVGAQVLAASEGRADDEGSRVKLSSQSVSESDVQGLLATDATLVWSGSMRIARDPNATVQTAFPLKGIVRPEAPGAYLVVAEDAAKARPESFYTPGGAPAQSAEGDDDAAPPDIAAHWAMVTDIALTTLSGPDGLHVLARSLATAMPLPGLALSLHSLGQEVLDRQTTDAKGEAVFAPGLLRGKGAASAETLDASGNGDFAMLGLARPAFDFSDRGASGLVAPDAIQCFVALDRDLFRPGETVNATALLRDASALAAADMPLTLVLLRPDGVEARQLGLAKGLAGGFHAAFALTASAARGRWTIEARLDPKGKAVGSAGFDVQDFVPQQLKVSLASPLHALVPGQPVDVTLNGRFLYGAPAAGLHGEAELSIQRDPSPVAGAEDFQFGLVTDETPPTVQKLELPDADDAGDSRITTALDPMPATSVPLKGVLTAGLFEPSGRVVDEHLELPIRNQPLLIGLRAADTAPGGAAQGDGAQPVAFDVRAFTGDAQPAARAGLQWRIVREDVRFDWVRSGARWAYHRHALDVPVASGTVDVAAATPGRVAASLPWGTYRLVVSDAASGAASSMRRELGWSVVSSDDDTPDKVAVTTDTPVVAAGHDVRLHVDAPFAGQAQVTVMGSRIFETRSIAVPLGGADVTITARVEWGQGAYVMVDVVRPMREVHGHAPVRAVGLAWVALDQAAHTLAVTLDAPERMVPRQPLRVPVHVRGGAAGQPAWVSLAAVDEGILQLTRFATPDPAAFLFGKRRLGFDMRDDYGHLLDGDAAAGQVREGGDSPAPIGGASLAVTSTKIVSLFSGPVALDSEGNGVLELAVPDFEGQLRLMALAWSAQGVGSAEVRVTVRDPVLADLSLPRFLAPGDDATLAVSVADTDGAAGDYRVEVASAGAARLAAGPPLQWHLAQGERQQGTVAIHGVSEGVATVGVDLTGPAGYRLHRDWQIAVRSPHYPVTLEQTAAQNPGDTFRLDPRVADTFAPGGFTVSVGYSGLAGIDVPALLQSLYRYPYGCTEQLASSAWPLIYFRDPRLLGSLPRDEKVGARVQTAVDSIVDREDAGGRFGLWRTSDGLASAWLNAYVLDFLLHARDAGFDVPDEALQRSRRWIQQRVRGEGGNDDGTSYAEGEANSRAYGEYVLARMGHGDLPALRRDRDALSGQAGSPYTFWSVAAAKDAVAAPLALAELAGSLLLMGDKAGAKATFAHALANLALQARAWPAWWSILDYGSPIRDLAQMSAVAADTGNDVLAHSLIAQVAALKPASESLNTQEKAALLSAAHALSRDDAARRLRVDGTDGPLSLPAEFAPGPDRIAAGFETVNTGTKTLWRTLTIHGAPRDALPALSHGYTLHREYLGLDGKPVDPGKTRQNDRLIVALHGQMTDKADRRTVLVELLPAGWEIESVIPDAGKDGPYAFLAPLGETRVEEARDDRFVASFDLSASSGGFGGGGAASNADDSPDSSDTAATLPPDQFHVAYLVRVVTPGHFVLPEAEVEDMYHPDVMARTGAGAIGVAPR